MIAGIGMRFGISRRCTRLEWAVADVQTRLGSLHGQKASQARWKADKTLEDEFQALQANQMPTKRRFDNDPLVGEPERG